MQFLGAAVFVLLRFQRNRANELWSVKRQDECLFTRDCRDPATLAGAAPAQTALIPTSCGLAFSVLMRCTVSTPSLNSALNFAGLALSGSEKLRPKRP